MKKRQGPVVGTTIHIGKPFESYDGIILKNRFMGVFSVENDNLILIPMSTFHNKEKRDKKLKMLVNFEYSQKHGNNRDGYLKCNQFYFLNKKEYDNFKELYVSRTMNQKRFDELQEHVENLQKNKVKFLKKRIVFEDSFTFQQKDSDSESVFTSDELVKIKKDEQKFMERFKKAEAALKKSQQLGQEVDEDDNEFDDYER
ncbi:hypothetical protein LT335_00450 [Spiroplasma sp. JKS002669]|uniref:hypothetical protein n=1 Tax=Spiroplasma attinicola TaxID=2904537 RepID=UPI0020C0E721|nr:hypothetical protein [Spiroplasma sp. JKS002669]MCL6428902.1 hypothetical protein [Spiroplasma sp. JKS002669]